jgi:ribosome maturation factor RimP
VVDAVFQTNQSPPVLRLDVRNLHNEDTSLDDCEKMSQDLRLSSTPPTSFPMPMCLKFPVPGFLLS